MRSILRFRRQSLSSPFCNNPSLKVRDYQIIDTNAENVGGRSHCGNENANNLGHRLKTRWRVSCRSSASFGKRQEYVAVSELLRQGFGVYMALADDLQIDCIIRQEQNGAESVERIQPLILSRQETEMVQDEPGP